MIGILILLLLIGYGTLYFLVLSPLFRWAEARHLARVRGAMFQPLPPALPEFSAAQSALLAAYKKQMKLTRPLTKGELTALLKAGQ